MTGRWYKMRLVHTALDCHEKGFELYPESRGSHHRVLMLILLERQTPDGEVVGVSCPILSGLCQTISWGRAGV